MPDLHADLLELWWHVCEHRGFHPAARALGRSQSVISEHVRNLEAQLGERLCTRTPEFAPTAAGEALLRETAEPIHRIMEALRARNSSGAGAHVRLAASDYMLREYLVPLLERAREIHPTLRLTLTSGRREHLERSLADHSVDLVFQTVDEPAPGFHWHELFALPLVLLTPANLRIPSADTLWADETRRLPLACPPQGEGVTRNFLSTLRARGIRWPATVEAACTSLLPLLVASGKGMAPCVQLPSLLRSPRIRALALSDFPPVWVGILHRGKLSPEAKTIIALAEETARTVKR